MRVIAGKAGRLLLKSVPGYTTRPTTDKYKETLFNILQMQVPGSVFLDVFAVLSFGQAHTAKAQPGHRAAKQFIDFIRHRFQSP